MDGIKFKKIIYMYFFALFLGIVAFYPNSVYADKPDLVTCNYSNSDNSTKYTFTINDDYTLNKGTSIITYFNSDYINKKKGLANWSWSWFNKPALYNIKEELKSVAKTKDKDTICPNYIIIQKAKVLTTTYTVYGFYDKNQYNETQELLQGTNISLLGIDSGENITPSKPVDTVTTCEKVLGSGKGSVAELLQKLFNYIKVLGPVLVILFSALDFTKTILASDDEAMKKSQKKLGIRLACAVGIYFLPMFATLIINLVLGTSGDQVCGIK